MKERRRQRRDGDEARRGRRVRRGGSREPDRLRSDRHVRLRTARRRVAEMARISRDLVVVEDTLYVSEAVEEAEILRDPTHIRSYSEAEWRGLLEGAGLVVEEVERFEKRHPLDGWLARTGTSEEDGARVRELLAEQIEGDEYVDTKLLLRARKAA